MDAAVGKLLSVNVGLAQHRHASSVATTSRWGSCRGKRTTTSADRARSGLSVRWAPEHGSLLELAEACDVPADFGCRSGVCHACKTGILSGAVEYSPEPLEEPEPGAVLLCCSAPAEAIALDL
jgi:ferredoxin